VRYFFHVSDGRSVINDDKRAVLSGPEVAALEMTQQFQLVNAGPHRRDRLFDALPDLGGRRVAHLGANLGMLGRFSFGARSMDIKKLTSEFDKGCCVLHAVYVGEF
jgi:hypothetical protein